MKTKLLSAFMLFFALMMTAQPVITGDTILCPNTNGTATVTGSQTYDSYTWYWKYWFTSDAFQPVAGVTGPTFTYDWYTYDQALIKVEVTLNGETFESNTIQIDSYNWLPIFTGFEDGENDNISINPDNGNVLLCSGTSFDLQVFDPYSANIRWYKDGNLLVGEANMTLTITEPGVYHVEASPGVCPDNMSSTAGTPTIVEIDNDCSLGLPNVDSPSIGFSPNPVKDVMSLMIPGNSKGVSVYNSRGQKVFSKVLNGESELDVSVLSSGMYFLQIETETNRRVVKFIKE